MLVDLTINEKEVNRRKAICTEHNISLKCLSSHPDNHLETGVYRCGFDFNFSPEEFIETENLTYDDEYLSMVLEWSEFEGKKVPINMVSQYGVADSVEQIKEFYKTWLDDPDKKWVITVTPVYQDKSKAGVGGGWRWHKWGQYIGTLEPEYEYLDDEDFGEDFQGYVLCYHVYPVK